jgi:hypothetical protein
MFANKRKLSKIRNPAYYYCVKISARAKSKVICKAVFRIQIQNSGTEAFLSLDPGSGMEKKIRIRDEQYRYIITSRTGIIYLRA